MQLHIRKEYQARGFLPERSWFSDEDLIKGAETLERRYFIRSVHLKEWQRPPTPFVTDRLKVRGVINCGSLTRVNARIVSRNTTAYHHDRREGPSMVTVGW